MSQKILIIDDELGILRAVEERLALEHFETITCTTAEQALETLTATVPDVMIVDVRLPGMNGFDFCKTVRKMQTPAAATPIIFLTTLGDETSKVAGLEIGGDDYLAKPFSPAELIARIRALIRRSKTSPDLPEEDVLSAGPLTLDKTAHHITLNGKPVDLPPKAFSLLYLLVQKKNKVLTRPYLMQKIWGVDVETSTRTIDTHIKQLRKALGKTGAHIKTVEGIGYKWTDTV